MGTKNNPAPNDCYEKALPDEEMFVLLARDPNAPAVIEYWMRLRAITKGDADVIQEAAMCARKMTECRSANMGKWRESSPEREQRLVHLYLSAVESTYKAFKKWNKEKGKFRGTLEDPLRRVRQKKKLSDKQLIYVANFHDHYVKFALDQFLGVPPFPASVYRRAKLVGNADDHNLV